jgi:hypothetical protein
MDEQDQFPPIEGNNTSVAGPLIIFATTVLICLILLFG